MSTRSGLLWMCGTLLATGALLGGCGQRGALYLPDESRNVVVTPAQPASAVPAGSPVPAASPVAPADAPTDPTEEQRRNNAATPAK